MAAKAKQPPSISVLALSDEVDPRINSSYLKVNFPDVELVISCGDLPYQYLEHVVDFLNIPMFFVHGNHDPEIEIGEKATRHQPRGAENLDNRVVRYKGVILAGLEGSLRYSKSKYQYTQFEMWFKVLRLVPRLVLNRIFFGRALDVLVTHAPAWGVSDRADRAHRGFKAFRWLLEIFKPRYHLHGHIHQTDRSQLNRKTFGNTEIINAYVFTRVTIEAEGNRHG